MWRPSFSEDELVRAVDRVVVHGDRALLVPHLPAPLDTVAVDGVELTSSIKAAGLGDGDTCDVRGHLSADGLTLESVERLPRAEPSRVQLRGGDDRRTPRQLPASIESRLQTLAEQRRVLTYVLSRRRGFRIIAFDTGAVRSALAGEDTTGLPAPQVIASRWTADEIDEAEQRLVAVPHVYASGGGLGEDDQFRFTCHVCEGSPELDALLRTTGEGLVEASVWFTLV